MSARRTPKSSVLSLVLSVCQDNMGKKPLMPNDLDYVAQGLRTNQEVDDEEKLKAFSREATVIRASICTQQPYLMVRDGLLSLFKSKLFTDSRGNTSLIGGGRPGSSLSTVTKSGAIKMSGIHQCVKFDVAMVDFFGVVLG
ncbi:hypothetical protein BKA70DRAFT_1446819 [Coprinopsis sp. MPI-PUGE-AT-0042]|nr:hypothetical protein BKA70DRAFT_1446819 [Coprinopsis sp. MPI-PUGE-AT-0042]